MPIKRLQLDYYRRHYHFRKTSVVLANTQRVLSLVEEGLLKWKNIRLVRQICGYETYVILVRVAAESITGLLGRRFLALDSRS